MSLSSFLHRLRLPGVLALVVAAPSWAPTGTIADKCGDALCLARADGSAQRHLLPTSLHHPLPQWDPAFSPDGRWLAFRGYPTTNGGDGSYALYVVRTDGCGLRRLTASIAGSPTWSPDGRWIAFDTSGEGQIWKIRADGTGLVRVAIDGPAAQRDSAPAWSPDGHTLAFVHQARDGRGQIWAMRAGGGAARLLQRDARASDGTPAWSPDGSEIAFAAEAGDHSRIEIMRADGSALRALTPTSGQAWDPVWLPGAEGIAYLSGFGGPGMLVATGLNGGSGRAPAIPRSLQFTWSAAALPRERC